MEADVLFVGPVPRIYHECLGPIMFEAFGAVIAERVGQGDRDILETAAGTGIVTRAVAAAVPGSRILATDLNPDMLAVAQAGPRLARVTWARADALALGQADATFDLVICSFGIMFMPDKVAAFAEARRVLRPGGRFLFTLWDRIEVNPVTQAVSEALADLYPSDPPRFIERVPFGYHDPERVSRDARAGGFADIRVEVVRRDIDIASVDLPARGICQGTPARAEIEARSGGSPGPATAHVAGALRERFGAGPFRAPAQALVVTAR